MKNMQLKNLKLILSSVHVALFKQYQGYDLFLPLVLIASESIKVVKLRKRDK